jgi:hypothetical protein
MRALLGVILVALYAAAGILVVTVAAQSPGKLPTKGATEIISSRPLADAAWQLEHLYGKVVTYEEPVLTWSGELWPNNGNHPDAKWGLSAAPLGFTMPADTGIEPNLAKVLDETLQAYHRQTTGTRFKIVVSDYGFHIVPTQVHDESGKLVSTGSLLDTRISVPIEARTPARHYMALLAAITSVSGTKVDFNGVRGGDPEPAFVWGGTGVVARDALIDLLRRSSTTVRWGLWCQPSAKTEDRMCALNMSLLEVTKQ